MKTLTKIAISIVLLLIILVLMFTCTNNSNIDNPTIEKIFTNNSTMTGQVIHVFEINIGFYEGVPPGFLYTFNYGTEEMIVIYSKENDLESGFTYSVNLSENSLAEIMLTETVDGEVRNYNTNVYSLIDYKRIKE